MSLQEVDFYPVTDSNRMQFGNYIITRTGTKDNEFMQLIAVIVESGKKVSSSILSNISIQINLNENLDKMFQVKTWIREQFLFAK